MKTLLLFLMSVLTCSLVRAQEHAWVYFKDKPSASSYLASPLTMLSKRALDRRVRQNVTLDEYDVPVESTYYHLINNASGIAIVSKSKWLNAVHVLGDIITIRGLIETYSFIESIEFANNELNTGSRAVTRAPKEAIHHNKFNKASTDFNYGNANHQIEMLGGEVLHANGFTGEGMHIAVIDAGFPNVNTLSAFSRLRENNKILGGYDFVSRHSDFYTGHNHGTNVLSDIAGYIEGEFIGTAPDASFYLFRSEDAANETPLEETLWVEAAEQADSLGVDIINTSLGYTTFDNASYDYTYDDLNGRTAFISRGAEIGASRGMLLVNAAGNSGNDAWKYIGVPADAESVFTIGAVNATETIASFSSFGPTADGRIKPDVLAQGQGVSVINHISGSAITSNGTSFSSPVIAGVIACFWQAFPNKTNFEIMQIIRESADRYTNPTDHHGYGVPDFKAAFNTTLSVGQSLSNVLRVFPNPFNDLLWFEGIQTNVNDLKVRISSMLGEELIFEKLDDAQFDVSILPPGLYIVEVFTGNSKQVFKLMKQ